MLVIIKSAPGTDDAQRALSLGRKFSADIILMQDAVYLAGRGGLDGYKGKVYVIEEDLKLRGAGAMPDGVETIGYDGAVDLMAAHDKTLGMF